MSKHSEHRRLIASLLVTVSATTLVTGGIGLQLILRQAALDKNIGKEKLGRMKQKAGSTTHTHTSPFAVASTARKSVQSD